MAALMSLPFIALVVGVVLALVALLTLELLAVRRINSIMSPALQYARAKAEEEAEHILATARENARSLMGRTEAASAAMTAERAKEDEAARHAHEEALKATRERFETSLSEVIQSAKVSADEAQKSLMKEISTLGESARTDLKAAVDASAKTFGEELTRALTESRAGLLAYETARKEAVEAHIHELVAQTTKIALAQSLPESVSADLVLKALKEAKASGAF